MDLFTIIGLVGAIAAILVGQALEGGHAGSLMQLTAAMIVLGGAIGATMVANTKEDILTSLRMGKRVFIEKKRDIPGLVKTILELAGVARRDGVLALEGKLATIDEAFLRRALRMVVDGVAPDVTRDTLEGEVDVEQEQGLAGAKVWEGAGGYAPSVGILGAVLGLIHVMENLSDPSKLGPGIAVAFVATVYGVGSANLLFLPMGAKIKRRLHADAEHKQIILIGVLGIQEGLNPRVLEERLAVYVQHAGGSKEKTAEAAPAGAAVPAPATAKG